jgi:hypothetical protein
MKEPVLALVMFVAVGQMQAQRFVDAIAIVLVHARVPLIGAVADFLIVVAEHRLPPRRPMDLVRRQIPVPQRVVGSADRQRVALLAGAKIFDRLLVRQVRVDPRERHREVDRLGQVVVRAELEGLNDVGALRARGDHDDRKLGLGTCAPQLAEHLEPAHARHLDVEQDEVVRIVRDQGQRGRTVLRDGDDVASLPQAPRQHVPVRLAVIDDEKGS